MRSAITLPHDETLVNLDVPAVALSPGGTHLAYVGSRSGTQRLFLQVLDSLEAKPIEGTEGAAMPFFSPDGHWLGFYAAGRLKKVSITGGAPVTLCAVDFPDGASWGDDDTIVFAGFVSSGLWQVSSAGGAPQPLTKFDLAKGEFGHWWP